MELKIFKDHSQLSAATADMINTLVKQKPDAVICLATGDTTKLTYQLIAEKYNRSDFKKCSFIGLDEWVSIQQTNAGSCHWFLHHYLFEPMDISNSKIFLMNGMVTDLKKECEKMNDNIRQMGGIDLMLAGVGMNGHIGFNEPGTDEKSLAHIVNLEEITLSVGKKYFNGTMETNKGITLGLLQVMEARKLIMVASGVNKSAIIKRTMEMPVSNSIPSTFIRKHRDAFLLLDEQAATELNHKQENLVDNGS